MSVRSSSNNCAEWEVLSPEAEYEISAGHGAARLNDLGDKKIALFWNGKSNGVVLLDEIGKLLIQRFDKVKLDRLNLSIGIGQEKREEIARDYHAVIAAAADCGSCTSHLFRDSIAIEKSGTPVVAIGTNFFIKQGRWIADAEGLPSLRSIEIPHPLAGLSQEVIRERAGAIIEGIISGLICSGEGGTSINGNKVTLKHETETISVSGKSGTDTLGKVERLFHERKWTDGFPIVPPTREAVELMLAGTDRDRAEIVGLVAPRWGKATLQNIAINAVMAGAEPAYMPVIIAAVEAVTDPRFAASPKTSWGAAGMQTTTGPITPFLIVNGPVARELGIASGVGCFGPGHRANATIGRALRLILINAGGSVPGVNDMKCHGSAWQFTFCVAEREEHPVFHGCQKHWKTLSVERGFSSDTSTVTVGATWPAINVEECIGSGHDILTPMVHTLSSLGQMPHDREWEYILVLSSTHAQNFADTGWSKDKIREFVYANSVMPWGTYKRQCYPERVPPWLHRIVDDLTSVHILESPANVTVVVAGGESQYSYIVRCVHKTLTKEIKQS